VIFKTETRSLAKALSTPKSADTLKAQASETPVKAQTQDFSLPEFSVKDLEARFSGLSEDELNHEAKLNSKMAEENQLFEKANTNKLDVNSSKLMVQYIRVNRVLNQILLDRKLEEIERDTL
jgi:hypothetical protein